MLKNQDYQAAMDHILEASKHVSEAKENWQDKAKESLKKAQVHAKAYERQLAGSLGQKESSRFSIGFGDHVNRINGFIATKSASLKKSESDQDDREMHKQMVNTHYNIAIDLLSRAQQHAIRGHVNPRAKRKALALADMAHSHISHFIHHADKAGINHKALSQGLFHAMSSIKNTVDSIKKSEKLEKWQAVLPPSKDYMGRIDKPKKDEYKYVPMSELHADDSHLVGQKYGSKNHVGHYEYPVHPDTGRLAHAPRKLLPPEKRVNSPKASPASYGEQFQMGRPTVGTSVRINSPGHEHHGRMGVVRADNPYFPKHVNIQIGHHAHETTRVLPSEVSLKKSEGKSVVYYLNEAKKLLKK